MPRFVSRTTQTLVDAAALSLAFWLSFLVRFDGDIPHQWMKRAAFEWPYVVAFELALMALFGIPRYSWRHVGLRETTRITYVLTIGAAVLLVVRAASGTVMRFEPVAQYAFLPLGIIATNFFLGVLGTIGVRALRRLIGESREAKQRRPASRLSIRTILVGAGNAGVLVAREISARPDLQMRPVAFVDDDEQKWGTVVAGIPVLGGTHQLPELKEKVRAEQALITIANAPSKEIRRIARACEMANMPTKIIPGLYEIVGGQVNLSRIRDVAIEDLLGRDQIILDSDRIEGVLSERSVLVTGAGGSIGSELCRQVCRFRPERLLLLERSENALFDIHRELGASFPHLEFVPLIADVGDRSRMQQIFLEYRPQAILHAAAHKHVPMMEWNPGEAVKNNVLGTRVVADLAAAYGAEIFVQISTDKAVNPTSIMGTTKRLAEMYVQALSERGSTRFVAVRFGNVLGSAGSVVQIFREQITRGGPVTITHPDMQRYFMIIPEACQLVLQAAALAQGGEIFVLDMGEPVRIVDLAREMIRLSGCEPETEIPIVFTGIRPGEKLTEELLHDLESHSRTVHPKILVGRIPSVALGQLEPGMQRLQVLCGGRPEDVQRVLGELVPEARLEGVGCFRDPVEPEEETIAVAVAPGVAT